MELIVEESFRESSRRLSIKNKSSVVQDVINENELPVIKSQSGSDLKKNE